MKLLIMQSSPFPYYVIPVSARNLQQRPTNYILRLEMNDTRTYTSSPLCPFYTRGVKTTFVIGSHFYRMYR